MTRASLPLTRMPEFRVTLDWHGYVRGTSEVVVEAESEEEAIKSAKHQHDVPLYCVTVDRDEIEFSDAEATVK